MKKLFVILGLAASACLAPLAAQAQVYPGYEKDRAYCASGRSGQSYNTCMREMRAAHYQFRNERREAMQERRHDRMEMRRALNRCENMRYQRDRQICKDRVRAGRY